MWVTERESRADIIDGYKRAWRHADATIESLPIDAPGFVPWWPRPDVKLFNVMLHVLTETNRHAGHADILREQLDGAVGAGPVSTSDHDDAHWEAHRSRIEQSVVEDVPADRASTLLVIEDQLSNLRGDSFSLPVPFPDAC
jgi:hypothetical protein